MFVSIKGLFGAILSAAILLGADSDEFGRAFRLMSAT
jgi:hypothetical protein